MTEPGCSLSSRSHTLANTSISPDLRVEPQHQAHWLTAACEGPAAATVLCSQDVNTPQQLQPDQSATVRGRTEAGGVKE